MRRGKRERDKSGDEMETGAKARAIKMVKARCKEESGSENANAGVKQGESGERRIGKNSGTFGGTSGNMNGETSGG